MTLNRLNYYAISDCLSPEAEALMAGCPVPVLILQEGRVCGANEAACVLYGLSPEEWQRVSYARIAGREASYEEGRSRPEEHRFSDGTPLPVRVTMVAAPAGGKADRLVYVMEAGQAIRMEERFLQAQRLECLGALSNGVAHDLNNMLTPILVSAAMLHEPISDEGRAECIAAIEQSALRGVNLLREVLSFSRGVEGEHTPVRLDGLIEEVVSMARRTFPRSITIETELEEGAEPFVAESTRLHQVLLNLAINARDAMPEGGVLTFRLRYTRLDEAAAAQIPEGRPGHYLVMEVSDTGAGIPPEALASIFTPFFTTKARGMGTGLGLPTVLGIAIGYGGFVGVESVEGEGSTFRVYLPAGGAHSSSLVQPLSYPDHMEGYILIVDDEPGVRKMIRTILTRDGYQVLEAADGHEAMAEYLRDPSAIRVIIADLIMPEMDGIVLTRAIKRLNPDAAVIATSGVDLESRIPELEALGVTSYLRKPFQTSELIGLIESHL